jgi:hypothetical protein
MNIAELKMVMEKWANLSQSELRADFTNHLGDHVDFAFLWTKPMWSYSEYGWSLLDSSDVVLVNATTDGELFFSLEDSGDDLGYFMVLGVPEAEDIDKILELIAGGSEELFDEPEPTDFADKRLGELRAWFEETHNEDEECGEDCDCTAEGEACECGEEDCECHEHNSIDTRLVTVTCDVAPAPQLHCPVCGKSVGPEYCAHVLFVNKNEQELAYIAPGFAEELAERGVSQEDFAIDPEQLRQDDSWDTDYLFLDLVAMTDEEIATDIYVGFHFKW